MTIKQLLSPVLQFIKSVVEVFIPFYWLKTMSSKFNQMNTNNEDLKGRARAPDNYKIADVDNQRRAGIRAFYIVGFMMAGVFLSTALIAPFGWAFAVAVIVGIGILPKIGDMMAKQTIRLFSWFMHKDDPTIINPYYPAKYKAFAWSPNSYPDKKIYEMKQATNASTQTIMKNLYLKKQEIKLNPEGWFGLSDEQQKQCSAINLALKFFRKNSAYRPLSHLHYPDPEHKPTESVRVYERSRYKLEQEDGFTAEMKGFLDEVIDLPTLG